MGATVDNDNDDDYDEDVLHVTKWWGREGSTEGNISGFVIIIIGDDSVSTGW